MSLELKEVCTLSYQHESMQPFSIQCSSTGIFSIITKNSVQIMRPEFTFRSDLNHFNIKPSVIKCPQGIPTHTLDTEEIEIYNSADRLERQLLLLDQRFLPKLTNKEAYELVQSRAVAWNQDGHVLGYLSNYGALEMYKRIKGDNEWECILDVGSEYLKYLLTDKEFPLKTMNNLYSCVQDILLTSICFCEINSEEMLIATTKSDKLVSFRFDSTKIKSVEVASIVNHSQHHVIVIKPIQIGHISYLVAGDMDGKICVYQFTSAGDFVIKCYLWEDKDLLAVKSIEVSLLENGYLIMASKGGYAVAFYMDSNMACIGKTNELICSMPITGLIRISETSFMATILTGEVRSINISLRPFLLKSDDIHLNFSLPGSSLYGIAPSHNQAYFILASFVTQSHDHLTLRLPLNLTICRLSSSNPIKQLLSTPSMTLSHAIDNAELIRYLAAKDLKLLLNYEESINLTQNIGLTNKFLLLLKVSIILAGARFTYFRLRCAAEADISSKRISRLCQILEVVTAYNVLTCLISRKTKLDSFETLAGRCLKLSIQEYISAKPATEEFTKIYDDLTPTLLILMQESGKFSFDEDEICSVCDKRMGKDSLKCEDGHNVVRCSISKVQITDFSPRMCFQCHRCILNDKDQLQRLVGEKKNLLMCPLCDIEIL